MNISARQWLARADRAHRREDMQDFIERAAAGALVEIAETLERAMSEQRGLRNPDTHGTTSDGEPYCESCGVCDEGWRCRCCLAAEVEALREKVKQHEVVFKVQAEALKSTREQVQRVRDAIQVADDLWDADLVRSILRALDGDNDA